MPDQPDLFDQITATPPREVAGSTSAKSLDYQQSWALAHLVDLHIDNKDYLIAFEYHDDVLIFDSPKAQSVNFAQVKTAKTGTNYTTTKFTSRSKGKTGKKPSTMGKLLNGLERKEHKNKTFTLVSNVPFNFINSERQEWVHSSKISKEELAKIKRALAEELPEIDVGILANLSFHVSLVPREDPTPYLLGKITELFSKKFGPQFRLNVGIWMRVVQEEIRKLNNIPASSIKTKEELLKNKCLSRAQIEKMLDDYNAAHIEPIDFKICLDELKDAGWTLPERLALKDAIAKVCFNSADSFNKEFLVLKKEASQLIEDLTDLSELSEVLKSGSPILMNSPTVPDVYKSQTFIQAILLVTYYEKHTL